ncbi:MAG: 3-deoxy-manno-octulosonate cytidylyltransferase [Planctomycetota bacterium]
MARAPKRATAIIPARLASTRFPRKALADDTGKPMVVHVCEQAAKAERVERVVVATDAEEIAEAVRAHGFEAVMTGEHDNGTSRIAEAAETLELKKSSVVVNVQGDEPEIDPELIEAAISTFSVQLNSSWELGDQPHHEQEKYASVGTVACPFEPGESPDDPNIVKAVVGVIEPVAGVAPGLYFSRAPIPFDRDGGGSPAFLKHLGIYAYHVRDLFGFLGLPPTPLEQTEKLEQLRWLEHGLTIAVAIRRTAHHGIDTPEQYAAFVERHRSRS